MKKLISTAIAFLIASAPGALAQQLPIPASDFPTTSNKLVNPGFEQSVGTTGSPTGAYGWTASGGATKTANTTAKGQGTYGFEWDSNSASQTLVSTSYTIEPGLYGKNGLAFCHVKVPSGTATHTITVNDGSNDIATAQTLTSYSTTHAIQPVAFTFPSSGTVKIKITSVASNEPSIYIDSCYLGENFKVGQENYVSNWVSYTPTGSWSTNTTYTGKWRRIGDSMEVQANITLSGAPTSATLTINLPSGYTIDTAKLSASSVSTDNTVFGFGAVLDGGTATYDVTVNYSTTSAVTLTYQQSGSSNQRASVTQAAPITFGNTDQVGVFFRVPITGWGAGEVYAFDSLGWRVDANISGANVDLSASDQSSYAPLNNGSLTLTNATGNGVLTAWIGCVDAEAPSGTTCSGNENVGVSWVQPAAGDVLACVSFGHLLNLGASGAIVSTFQLVETATNDTDAIVQEGKSRVASNLTTASTVMSQPLRVCGTFSFSSAGRKMIRLFYEQDITATVNTNAIYGDASSIAGQRDIHWEVYPLSQPMPAPVFVGSATFASSTPMRELTAVLNCDASSTITSQSGTTSEGVATIGNVSSGVCAGTFAGMWSSTTGLVCNGNVKGSTLDLYARVDPTSTTAFNLYCVTPSTGAAASACDVSVHCVGPK